MKKAPPISYIIEVAIEAFVTGLFMSAGEAVITESVKAFKRFRKKKKKAAECTPPADPE